MSEESITSADTGKPVLNPDGTQIGIVAAVNGETVRVHLNPGLVEDLQVTLGGDEADDEYTINAAAFRRNPRADVAVFKVRPSALA